MITKNEFYGAYLIRSEECGEDFTVWDCLKEAERAWDALDQLQNVPFNIPVRITGEELQKMIDNYPPTSKDVEIGDEL